MGRNSEFDLRNTAAAGEESSKREINKKDFDKKVFNFRQILAAKEEQALLDSLKTLTAKDALEKSQDKSTGYASASLKPAPVVTKDPKPAINPTIVSGRKPIELDDCDPFTQQLVQTAQTNGSGPLAKQGLANIFMAANSQIKSAFQSATGEVDSDEVEFVRGSSGENNADQDNTESVVSQAQTEVQPTSRPNVPQPSAPSASVAGQTPVLRPTPTPAVKDEEKKEYKRQDGTNKKTIYINDLGIPSGGLVQMLEQRDRSARIAGNVWARLMFPIHRLVKEEFSDFDRGFQADRFNEARTFILEAAFANAQLDNLDETSETVDSIANNLNSFFYHNDEKPSQSPSYNPDYNVKVTTGTRR